MNERLKKVLIFFGILYSINLVLGVANIGYIIIKHYRTKKLQSYKQLGPDYLTEEEYKKTWYYIKNRSNRPLRPEDCQEEAQYWHDLYNQISEIKNNNPKACLKTSALKGDHNDLLKENEDLKERIERCKKIEAAENEIKTIFAELQAKIDKREKDIDLLKKLKIKGDSTYEECLQLYQKIDELRRAV